MNTRVRALGIFSAVTIFLGALVMLLFFLVTLIFVSDWYKRLILVILVHLLVLYGLVVSNAIQKKKQNLTLVLSIVWIIILASAFVLYLVINS
ncbi:MAG: hypothetical protein QOH25_2672 [Acidobacteriota bacterium]|jgi:hypothetical protein|nr:hypothetical protein [Acidobacteriota bacterium]